MCALHRGERSQPPRERTTHMPYGSQGAIAGTGLAATGFALAGWASAAEGADIAVCMDADTTLGPLALADWEQEFDEDRVLGGCSAKFTMIAGEGMTWFEKLLVRLQRAEFAKWTDLSLKRGRRTSVL